MTVVTQIWTFLPIIGHDKFFRHIEQQKYKLCYVRFLIKCRFK